MRCAPRGFTLVELLVVIGMLTVLLSILLPAVNKVRLRARTAECAANLHTFGQAWQMYASTNSGTCVPGRLPTAGAPNGVFGIGRTVEYRPRWYELLGEQVAQFANNHPSSVQDDSWTITNRLFLCPAIPDWNNSRNFPYGYNYQFLGNARPKAGGGWINYPVKAARINGARTVLAADCLGTAAGKPKTQRTHYYANGSHDPAGLCNKGWCLDPPRMTSDSDY